MPVQMEAEYAALRAEKARKAKRHKKIGVVVVRLLFRIALDAMVGVALMMVVSVAHNNWWPAVPGMGFWAAWAIVVWLRAASLFAGSLPPYKDKEISK